MLVDDMEDILKVWSRSDMIKLRKSYSLVGVWVGLGFVKYMDRFKSINTIQMNIPM